MIPYQKIGELNIFVNSRNPIFCDFSLTERELLSKEIQTLYESLIANNDAKNEIYVEAVFSKSGDLVISMTLFVKFVSLYKNTIGYNKILRCLDYIIGEIKNKKIILNGNENITIAISKLNLASLSTAIKLFERSQAELLKENNNGNYNLFKSEEELNKFFNTKLSDNFFFVNCHRLTEIHEIDVKLMEARYCLALGLSLSSIAMLCITLEETLKSLLKYKLLKELSDKSTDGSKLEHMSRVSKAVQKKYGGKTLNSLILLSREKGIINDEEKKKFDELKILRDGHLHSDKSKIFSKNKAPVQLFSMEDGFPKLVEVRNMGMDELIFAKGVTQKHVLDRDAKFIFFEIEEHLITVCKRFWEENYN
ncbi:MAG: hypothetical protein GYA14_03780 [Ignavibacteria bacterium]|nr:hypothetical protein [Ignavibacteria bacterium]